MEQLSYSTRVLGEVAQDVYVKYFAPGDNKVQKDY